MKIINSYIGRFLFELKILFIVILLCLFLPSLKAQITINQYKSKNANLVEVNMLNQEVALNNKEIISNVIRIKNNNSKPVRFFVDISHPGGWKSLNKKDKIYELNEGDSIFIPVRIMPLTMTKGSTKYLINAFVISDEDTPLGGDFFFAVTKTVTSWELEVNPSNRVYFLNKENTANFNVSLFNTGNENQNLLLSFTSLRRELLLLDTTERIVSGKVYNLTLNPDEDTTFYFNVKFIDGNKNFRRIDIENHRPRTKDDERKMTMFVNSTEPRSTKESPLRKGEKVDFLKLSNENKISNHAGRTIPLIAEANVNNMLSQSPPMLNLILRGNTTLPNDAELVYFSQLDFVSNYFSTSRWTQPSFYTGYFDEKVTVEVGDMGAVAGGVAIGGGRGIRGSYFIDPRNKTGAYFFRSPRLFNGPAINNYGISHDFYINKAISTGATIGRIENPILNKNLEFVNVRTGYSINQNHRIGLNLSGSRKTDIQNNLSTLGYSAIGTYSNNFFENRFSNQVTFNYTSRQFGFFNQERLFGNLRSFYTIDDKSRITLISNYQGFTRPRLNLPDIKQTNFFNQLIYGRTTPFGVFSPLAFYNMSNIFFTRVHYRGLGIMYSWYNLERNIRVAANIRAGYNKAIDERLPEYFSSQMFFYTQYRTLTFNVRYLYGPNSVNEQIQLIDKDRNPQTIFLSLQHQYLFGREHFVIQNNLNYSHMSHFLSHNIGYFPTIYYYSKTGWRFRLMIGYNLSIRNYNEMLRDQYDITQEDGDYSATMTRGMNIGVGVRKEFGIPFPRSKQKNFTAEFVAFYDVNGNGTRDKNESLLENVVVVVKDNEKFLQWEVITNDRGTAKMINIPMGEFELKAFSLVELEGWFPGVDNKIIIDKDQTQYIPFVKGVKLHGNIFINREKIAVGSENDLDLSNIRISALDGKKFHTLTNSDGSFSFYLPYGKYYLSMDENVLGDRFTLVQNDFEIDLDETTQNLFIPFYVVERRRTIVKKKFGADGQIQGTEVQQPSVNEDLERQKKQEEERRRQQELENQKQKQEEENQQNQEGQNEQGNNNQNPVPTEPPVAAATPVEEEKDDYDYADMSNINELDSLINILLNKTGANVTKEVINQIENKTIANNDISAYKGKVSFAIQVGAFNSGDIPAETLASLIKLGNVASIKGNDGLTRYLVGPFDSVKEANKAKKEISDKGVKDSFTVGVNDGEVITSKEAEKLLKSK